jgi:Flp pilus assembly protein TadB
MNNVPKIPTVLVPPKIAIERGKSLLKFAYPIASNRSNLVNELKQADIEISPTEYVAAGLYSLVNLMIVLVAVSTFIILVAWKRGLLKPTIPALLLIMDATVPMLYFLYFLNYPKLASIRRVKKLELELPEAIREIGVKIKAGEPIFNALLEVSQADYGELSKEFAKVVTAAEAGKELSVALEEEARRSPSNLVRRILETLSNAVKAGGSVAGVLDTLNEMVIKKQQTDFQAYSRSLMPLSLGYMLMCIVLPSLGSTILVLLGSIAGVNPLAIIIVMPILVVVFEFFFISTIANQRPIASI